MCGFVVYRDAFAFAHGICQCVHGRCLTLRHAALKPFDAGGLLFVRLATVDQPAAIKTLPHFVAQHADRHEVAFGFVLRHGVVKESVGEPHECTHVAGIATHAAPFFGGFYCGVRTVAFVEVVHGHKQCGMAVTFLGGLLHPVQVTGFFFIGFGVALKVMAIGIFGVGITGLQSVFEVR